MATSAPAQPYEPYGKGAAANAIYDLLFCDNLDGFRSNSDSEPPAWEALLFEPAPDSAQLAALANDTAAESRVRALAFNRLRDLGSKPPKGVLFGVVVEVPLDKGLDALAAYADGRVRYINQTGKMAIVEPDGMPDANGAAKRLVELARPVIARIGLWDKPRLPPPARPNVRLTFIVSDGLYFGEGPFQALQRDALAGPLIQEASVLLKLVVDTALAGDAPAGA
jgi:hypothetical protein